MLRLPHNRKTRIQLALVIGFVAVFYFGVRYAANRIESGHDFLELKGAISRGDLNDVKRQLRASAHVDIRSTYTGETALHVAVRHQHVGAVKLLLERGADPNAQNGDGQTPLHFVANQGIELAELLLDAGSDTKVIDIFGYSPLHYAAGNGDMELVRLLIERGSPLHTWAEDHSAYPGTPAVQALRWELGRVEIAEYILFDAGKGDMTEEKLDYLLEAAVSRGELELMRKFVEAGADPNATIKRFTRFRFGNGFFDSNTLTPAVTAILSGSVESLEKLVELGASLSDANRINSITLLVLAVSKNNPDIVAFLLDYGLDPDYANGQGGTALHTAARLNTADSARVLIERGADINVRNNYGVTPLYIAVESLSPNVLKLLLDHGADPTIADATGASPAAIARQRLMDIEKSGPPHELKAAKTVVDLLDAR